MDKIKPLFTATATAVGGRNGHSESSDGIVAVDLSVLLVESEIEPAGGVVGAGFDEFRWPRPVRPGDELHIESEVLEVRPSRARSNQGVIKVRTTTLNQDDEAVQVQIANLIVPRNSLPASDRIGIRRRRSNP